MKQVLKFRLVALLLVILTGSTGALAQYNPANPPEPAVRYKISVGITPAGAGYVSGRGSYLKGTSVYISTSGMTGYDFLYWTKNGEQYTTSRSFTYTVETEDADFVAVYQYNPANPAEPVGSNAYRLYLSCTPDDACSFNRTSGAKAETDEWVTLEAMPSQGFDFLGWYENGSQVSSSASFNYQMRNRDTYLVARFLYNPPNPDDPSGTGQTDVDNRTQAVGDINNDGVIDVTDAVLLINVYLGVSQTEVSLSVGDVNGDGIIDVSDAVMIINRYLTNQ